MVENLKYQTSKHKPEDEQKFYLASSCLPKTLVHYLEKLRGYHGEWSASGGPKAKTQGAAGPEGFWPWDLPRHSIHHDNPNAFPYNVILSQYPNILVRDEERMKIILHSRGSATEH